MQLHRAHEEFDAAGARPVLIGMGTTRRAAWFHRKYAPSLDVLADDERRSYKVAGLSVGDARALMGPKSVAAGIKHAGRSGVFQGIPQENVAQLGGSLVIATDGSVLYEQRAEHAGDVAEVEDLLGAIRGAG